MLARSLLPGGDISLVGQEASAWAAAVPLGPDGLPSQRAPCNAAMRSSVGAYRAAAVALGLPAENETAFGHVENVRLWRSIVARELPSDGPVGGRNVLGTHGTAYFINPKVAHTTIAGQSVTFSRSCGISGS